VWAAAARLALTLVVGFVGVNMGTSCVTNVLGSFFQAVNALHCSVLFGLQLGYACWAVRLSLSKKEVLSNLIEGYIEILSIYIPV
jgi:ABC-type amino acid transport system permease subunit